MGRKHKKHRGKSSRERETSIQDLLGDSERLVAKLLKWARKGKAKKLEAILSVCGRGAAATALTAVQDMQGHTLLHLASQGGHDDAVRVLLKYGASAEAQDSTGNTATHLAAAAGHCTTLQLLLMCDDPPDIHLRNDSGITIEQLVLQALGERPPPAAGAQQIASSSPEQDFADNSGHAQQAAVRGGVKRKAADAADDEAAWRRRLAEEASDDEWGGGGGGYTQHYGDEQDVAGQFGAGRAALFDATEQEDDDAWADRLWAEMHARRQTAARSAARSFASSFREAQAAQAAQREKEHAARMERLKAAAELLKEAQAHDARWRQRALQGGVAVHLPPPDPAQARAQYESRWGEMEQQLQPEATTTRLDQPEQHAKATAQGAPAAVRTVRAAHSIGFAAVPWPLPEGYEYTLDTLRDVLLAGVQGPADVKRRLRVELMRWHPDKFFARWSGWLAPADKDSIMARVKLISQALTSLMT